MEVVDTVLRWRRAVLGSLLSVSGFAAEVPAVTFHKHIAPILLEYCAPCHRPGESGPFPLLTYEDARKRAGQIAAVTRRRYMPPWLPESGTEKFVGERRLTELQIDLIGKWAAAGAPEGDASDSPPARYFTPGWQLGSPDLIVQASKPFRAPADGADVYWNFVLTPPVGSTRYVKAIEIRPGNMRAVHHANLLIDRDRSARRLEKVSGEGFAGMDVVLVSNTFDPDSHFLFWKPGGSPAVEPNGHGVASRPRQRSGTQRSSAAFGQSGTRAAFRGTVLHQRTADQIPDADSTGA